MYFHLQSLTNGLENRDFWSKFDHFETSFWTIFGVKKVLFPVFSKVFWSCSGSAWAVFLIEMSSFGYTFSYKVFFHTSLSQNFSFGVPRSPIKHRQGLLRATSCADGGGGGGGAYLPFGTLTMLWRFCKIFWCCLVSGLEGERF